METKESDRAGDAPKKVLLTGGRGMLGRTICRVLGGGGIKPGAEEIERNPRSRSAMLRGCEKL